MGVEIVQGTRFSIAHTHTRAGGLYLQVLVTGSKECL